VSDSVHNAHLQLHIPRLTNFTLAPQHKAPVNRWNSTNVKCACSRASSVDFPSFYYTRHGKIGRLAKAGISGVCTSCASSCRAALKRRPIDVAVCQPVICLSIPLIHHWYFALFLNLGLGCIQRRQEDGAGAFSSSEPIPRSSASEADTNPWPRPLSSPRIPIAAESDALDKATANRRL
jgi:hypothetical protein